MIKYSLLFSLLLTALSLSAQSTVDNVNIIPKPVYLKVNHGNFRLDPTTTIVFQQRDRELLSVATFFSNTIYQLAGYRLNSNKTGLKRIRLVVDKTVPIGPEGYLLKVTSSSVVIRASGRAGIFYGVESLLQTLPAIRTNAALDIPCMEIVDYPRFKWRGMHLDVSRHFFGPEVIKEYLDLMASYKMNVFHWHLTDDPGWRIEIRKYPKLTSVGAWRVDQTDRSWNDRRPAKAGEPATYGGYYTQEQIREIVKYAAERNITIVPEIEMPGHSAAAISAYPFLSCTQTPQLPFTGGDYAGISTNYCAGNDSVYTFLEDVLQEVLELFPSPYIHVGGDEVDKGPWKKCPRCQERIKIMGLRDEEELQSYFMGRIDKFLTARHRKLLGWDEILEGGLASGATVMSWRGEDGGISAAKLGHEVVMTPGTPCYFDHYQAGPEGEPLAIGGFNSVKMVYDYEPVPKALDSTLSHFVLGAQGNVWTEFIPTVDHLEYMVLPRMPALAETLWTPAENKDWDGFKERLGTHLKRYGQKGYNFCARVSP